MPQNPYAKKTPPRNETRTHTGEHVPAKDQPPAHSEELARLAAEIKDDLAKGREADEERLRRYCSAGEGLLRAKELIGCGGRWGAWLKANFGLRQRQAQKYTRFCKAVKSAPGALSDLGRLRRLWAGVCGRDRPKPSDAPPGGGLVPALPTPNPGPAGLLLNKGAGNDSPGPDQPTGDEDPQEAQPGPATKPAAGPATELSHGDEQPADPGSPGSNGHHPEPPTNPADLPEHSQAPPPPGGEPPDEEVVAKVKYVTLVFSQEQHEEFTELVGEGNKALLVLEGLRLLRQGVFNG